MTTITGVSDRDAQPPTRVLVLGDLHGNWRFAWSLMEKLDAPRPLLPPGQSRLILQLGDFGIWNTKDGARYLSRMAQALAFHSARLAFIDGNHEDFPFLEFLGRRGLDPLDLIPGALHINDRIWHIPRGLRWTWHDKVWMGLGGAVSVDKALRTEGVDWWPQEEITPQQASDASRGGPVDVMLTHDCPWEVAHPAFPPPPLLWDPADLTRSMTHQIRLQNVVNSVRPAHVIHGHLHMSYRTTAKFDSGGVTQVAGLADSSLPGSWGVFDTRELTWVDVD